MAVVRKNVTALTKDEQDAFINAVLALKRPREDRYQPFTDRHSKYFGAVNNVYYAHTGPSFLPWHRRFLLDFEKALQDASGNPNLGLPYWDWTQSRDQDRFPWTENFLGGNGDPVSDNAVTTGPFQKDKWKVNYNVGFSGDYLRRSFRDFTTLPTSEDVKKVLEVTPYDAKPWSSSPTQSFRYQLEFALHNPVHNLVGGVMGSADSPNDPVFFLHHCFIDKLWADWQKAHQSEPKYLPNADGPPNVVDLKQEMQPWKDEDHSPNMPKTPESLLDHTQWYTYEDSQVISLRAHANSNYVTAENNGASPLIANRTRYSTWEQFDEIDQGNGNIALRAHANNRYVSAGPAGTSPLVANGTTVGQWETFSLIHNSDDGSISLRSAGNGKYVTVEKNGNSELFANRTIINSWEKFDRIPN